MNIRDIVNRDIINLSNCDEEPIHIPGTIQPHGLLLAVNLPDLTVQFCSGNVDEYLGVSPQNVLGHAMESFIAPGEYELLLNKLVVQKTDSASPLSITLKNKPYHFLPHHHNGIWIFEFEPALSYKQEHISLFDQTLRFVKYMEQSQTLKSLCQKVAEEIKTITGYDRVMVYRFDKDYNGEIFAEAKQDDLEPFLGLHYPHTDIPAQARQLYIKNLLRIIPDISYAPVPIYTLNDAPEKNLDLSFSVLRSVSPIHVQYLQNMGVGGTLTISLMHEGNLWGLVACHHYSSKYLDYTTRISAQLQGHFLTSQINVRQQAEGFDQSKEVNAVLKSLLNLSFQPSRESLVQIINQPQLLALCNAAGVAVVLEEALYSSGTVPRESEILKLIQWAGANAKQGVFSTAKLVDDYEGGEHICKEASGIIFYSLASNNTACIIWFNPETLEEVHWGGDPQKAIVKDENGLHPRKSFATWKQVVKCQAREWTAPELSAAASFAYALQKHVSLILLTEEEARQRQLSQQLKESNEELENINWISTHDLKEPLRKIRMASSRLLSKEQNLSSEVVLGLNKMDESAKRMQQLITELTAFGKLGRNQEGFEEISLDDLLVVIKEELADSIEEKGAHLFISNLPKIHGVPVLVRQLFINLIENALKFSSEERSPEIKIGAFPVAQVTSEQNFHSITIADNGIGFDNKFSQDIFKIFNRLHLKSAFSGSGIGLALCKKIMQLHHGTIEASGVVDEGARFTLRFPANPE